MNLVYQDWSNKIARAIDARAVELCEALAAFSRGDDDA